MTIPVLERRIFIVCQVTPRVGNPAKTDKIPVNPATGRKVDAQDPANWMTLPVARDLAASKGLHVGIVLAESENLFCIDLDGARLPDGSWSPFALAMVDRFPGAYVEISHSGTGLHIYACRDEMPAHGTRTDEWPGLEAYSRARFILMTGTGEGSIDTNHTAALQSVIAEYLPIAPVARSTEWTTEPHPLWRGGGTDEQIIAACRKRKSIGAWLGESAEFSALWDNDEEQLAAHFPPDRPNADIYNRSSADIALANHLVYATGWNCEHALRLMMQSALVRGKWDREDWLRGTILKGMDSFPRWLAEQPVPAPIDPAAPPVDGQAFLAGDWIDYQKQQRMWAGVVYVGSADRMLMPNNTMLKERQFNAMFGGYQYQTKVDGTKPTNAAWNAYLYGEVVIHPRVDDILFDPSRPSREITQAAGKSYVNAWCEPVIHAVQGDVSRFVELVYKLLPAGNDAQILLAFMAAAVQHRGRKFRWAPFIQGVKGNGKTTLLRVLEYCVGLDYAVWPRADMLGKQFNSMLDRKLLICVDDINLTERGSLWDALKPLITERTLEVEYKGVDAVMRRGLSHNFMFTSNYKTGLPMSEDERRLAALFTAQQCKADKERDGLTNEYFTSLTDWLDAGGLAHVAHWLQHYDIPAQWNPAGACNVAPETSSTAEAIALSRGRVEQELAEALADGSLGRDGQVTSTQLQWLLHQRGLAHKVPRERRAGLMASLGYGHAARLEQPDVTGQTPIIYSVTPRT